MDPIADALASVRVQSVSSRRANLAAPWQFEFSGEPETRFAYILEGQAHLRGIDSLRLAAGDFVMLASERDYALSDDEPTEMIFGKLLLNIFPDSEFPSLIHLHRERTHSLAATLELLVAEMSRDEPTSPLILNRLADVVVFSALREHSSLSTLPVLSDPQIGESLRSMHQEVDKSWTVAELAATAGMSRSAYAQRFKHLTGEGPVEYLTRWRMRKASEMLRERGRTLSDVAVSVGYSSDGAFHKAFRRVVGVSPGEYRRNSR